MAKERLPRKTFDTKTDQDLTVDMSVEEEYCSASY